MTDRPLTASEARARLKARKARRSQIGSARDLAVSLKADRRARAYIERWLGGETHKQIAESEGIRADTVTFVIAGYRKRHPDAKVPKGKARNKV